VTTAKDPTDDYILERRDTPLRTVIADAIRAHGPMPIADYMQLCLQHPEHGYYRSKAVVGAGGDFITAPEISQMFGELIGLWSAVVWQQMGSPAAFNLIELGPGRGTMLADMLRAVRRVPGYLTAAHVTCVETSEVLSARQREVLGNVGCPVTWVRRLEDAADGAAIVIGNEFLDALPASQSAHGASGTAGRCVGLDAQGRLVFVPAEHDAEVWPISTSQADAFRILTDHLGTRAKAAPVAVLFLDYGHAATAPGDTLQAVRGHAWEHPLTSPGDADLTVQVDFQSFGAFAREYGLAVDGPTTQAEFLGSLGIVERASKLMAANPADANSIEMATARLIGPGAMGTRFKAMGLRSPALPPLPGLA
jgi:NADH dehydrogenase [ubiquinone] 1 alpha subcomplex assembly factor 7